MDLLDKLALAGRRYQRRRSAAEGKSTLELAEVLSIYDRKAILEAVVRQPGEPPQELKPDPDKKIKLSMLDLISELHPQEGSSYEVFETAPTGDLLKARIVVSGQGEVQMLIGRRTMDTYFEEDPVLDSIRESSGSS